MMNKIALVLAASMLLASTLPALAQETAPVPGATVTTTVTTTTDTSTEKSVTSETVVVDNPNIIEAAIKNPDLSTFVSAVAAAGLTAALQADGPYTVFAPTNEAFSKIPSWRLENWMKPENQDKLAALLKHHIVKGIVGSPEIKGSIKNAMTLQEDEIKIDGEGDAMLLDSVARVVKSDVTVRNGIIHTVDSVIIPKDMM